MRKRWVALSVLVLGAEAAAQSCPNPVLVNSYRTDAIPNAFQTITGAPSAVTVFDATTSSFWNVATPPTPLPIPFQFFGTARTNFVVASSGFIVFTGGTGQTAPQNSHPGDSQQPNDWIAPWWDEHTGTPAGCTGPGRVLYLYPAPDGSLTVEWNSVQFVVNATATAATGVGCYSFQAKLFPSTHPTQPNGIEFHYDLSSPPTPQTPCIGFSGWQSHLMVSATVGLENALGTIGVDATERGAGNKTFPTNGYRFVPASFQSRESVAGAYYGLSVPAVSPSFCHIEGLPGTNAFVSPGGGAGCGACLDNDTSGRLTGELFTLPWKFGLYGRSYRTADVHGNGYLALGLGWYDASFGVNLGTTDPDAVIAPNWGAWEGVGPSPTGACGSGSGLFWRVDGLPGARILTFEWHDLHDEFPPAADCATGSSSCSFQAHLYESSAGAYACAPAGCPTPGTSFSPTTGTAGGRIEFQWDGACALFGITAIENWKGTIADTWFPSPGGSVAFSPCDFGTSRYYGDANATAAAPPGSLCVPELKGNGVSPILGNPFGLSIVHATPGALALLLLDVTSLPGLATPVPPGGLPLPFGTLWVPLPPTVVLSLGATAGSGPCEGSANAPLAIPPSAFLAGAILFAQGATVVPGVAPFGFGLELTEGVRIRIGS
ncbi:MAG TPA: hypothetical protein VFI25_03950 [Planctomycetota bacterium]|jgi:hypothetical protein|nr:hypothetical protein [Planctomycetota bacterium]